jgi:hypothetical protein
VLQFIEVHEAPRDEGLFHSFSLGAFLMQFRGFKKAGKELHLLRKPAG